MANLIGKLVFKKILKETAENKFGKQDGLFERTPATRMDHRNIKFTSNKKKLRKALPPGLSSSDQEVLVKVKRRAYMLDMSLFSLCGLRFGWSSVIGLIPAIGDVFDMLLGLMVLRSASEANLPSSVRLRMLFNILLDFVVGLVPILGDLADAAYKCNTRNAILLEDYLRARGTENIRRQGAAPPVDLSLPEEYEQQPELYGATTNAYPQQSQHASPPPPPHPHMHGGAHRGDMEAQTSAHPRPKLAWQPARGSEKGRSKGKGKGKGKGGSSRG